MTSVDVARVLAALDRSHQRLAAVLASLGPTGADGPSYCDDWTIAQVASHLGSGAEIFGQIVEAGLHGEAAPGPDQFQAVWDRWNAKSTQEQLSDALVADRSFVNLVGGLDRHQVARWRLDFFGSERSLLDLVRMRLSEHALHSWDIAVALDPQARLEGDAVLVLVEGIDAMVQRSKPTEDLRVQITTTSPERRYVLHLSPAGSRLADAGGDAGGDLPLARVQLPAESLIRLVYGRLDSDHTPPAVVVTGGADLDVLRRAFPGL